MRRALVAGEAGNTNRRLLVIRSWVLAISAVAAIAIGALLGAPANAAPNPAEGFVQQKIDSGYNILNNRGLSAQARRTQFRQFLLGLVELKRIANFTLGPAARTTSDGDKAAFQDAFEDYAVAVYDAHLSKYRGQTLKVTGSQMRAASDVVVNAEVVNPNKPDAARIKVAFRVRKDSENRMVVTDMQVEGVWLAISQRDDFGGYLQQHNNSVPQLTAHLKRMAQRIERTGRVPAEGAEDRNE
jgi:phospholipid transport system substrate-binding protein